MEKILSKNALLFGMTLATLVFATPALATNYLTATYVQPVLKASGPVTITSICPPGYAVTGGGYSVINTYSHQGGGPTVYLTVQNNIGYMETSYFTVWASQPTAAGDGWQVTGATEALDSAQVSVYARCVSLT